MYRQEWINIIIADDSDYMCEKIKKLLSDIPGVRVAGCTTNSFAAVKLMEEIKPDVLILDIKIPDPQSIDELKKIKETNPHTVIIIYTNYPSSRYKAMCYRSGVDYFFDKSMEFQLIADVLHEMTMGHFYYIYN